MYTLSLEVANKCNLNCNYCYLGVKKNSYMSFDTAQQAVEIGIHEAEKQYDKTLIVYFIGGEPLLAIDLIKEVVTYIKKRCEERNINYTFSITTNGVLLTEAITNFFVENRFEVKVSLDGDRIVHDLNRKDYFGKGSHQIIMNNLKLLKNYKDKTGNPISFAHVITQNNFKYFEQSFQFLMNLECEKIESAIDYYCEWQDDELEELKNRIINTFYLYKNQLQKREKWFLWNLFEDYLKLYLKKCDFYSCKAGLTSVFISANGNIYTCVELPEFLIGNVQYGLDVARIREIVYIEDKVYKECESCEYLNCCCIRGCIAANFEIHNNIYHPVRVSCVVAKTIFELIEQNISKEKLEDMKKIISKENKKYD